MLKNQETNSQKQECLAQEDELPAYLEFGNLLNAEAQSEIRDFYAALESSKACKTVLVGYTPPRD